MQQKTMIGSLIKIENKEEISQNMKDEQLTNFNLKKTYLLKCDIQKHILQQQFMLSKAGLQHLAKHLNSTSQVVMRADFNVPIDGGKIKDANRIKATIPTIQQLLNHNPKSIVLLSHLGRPNGKKSEKFSLKPIVGELEKFLNRKVTFLDDCVGQSVLNQVKNANNEVFLCQNVRFHPEEEGSTKGADGKKVKADPEKVKAFRNQLSQLGTTYVNDAFGTAHRAHSSVVGLNHKYRVGGLLMEKQLKFLGNFLQKPKKPVVVILGGAKISDKIQLVKNMIGFSDEIIFGGGMKNPFLTEVFKKKLGATFNIIPEDPKQLVQLVELAKKKNCRLHFPKDYRVAHKDEMKKPSKVHIMTENQDIPDDSEVFDVGPESGKYYEQIISKAGSIFWNGPMGVIETPQFAKGSEDILKSMIKATKNGAVTIIGGGDSASLVNKLGQAHQLSFVSTGGGATIQLLEGKQLPGVKNLSDIKDL